MTARVKVGDRVTRRDGKMVGTVVRIDDAKRAKSNTNGGVAMARVEWPSGSTSRVTATELTVTH